MRVQIVSFTDEADGAARAANRLHQALGVVGAESSMLVRRKTTDDERIVEGSKLSHVTTPLRRAMEAWIQRTQQTTNTIFHSSNVVPSRWSRRIARLDPDVVNVHWVGAGTMSVRDIGQISQPVVMTLHDMWGFCGAEHYVGDEPGVRWQLGYSRANRPSGHRRIDLDRITWLRKRRYWNTMHLIVPSTWMADSVGRSALMSEWPTHVIPNAIDLGTFRPRGREAARHALGLPPDDRLLLFNDPVDPRKGVDLLVDALRGLRATGGERVVAVGIGSGRSASQTGFPIPLIWKGVVRDDETLAQLYSAADVVLVPSRQESFGQVASEAQACGTPVVAFSATGLIDVVDHRHTGYLAEAFSAADLAFGIQWALDDRERWKRLGEAGRDRALSLWDPTVVASRHLEVFATAVADHARGGFDG